MFSFELILNDGVMLLLTSLTLVIMAGIMVWCLSQKDIDWVWSFAFIVPYAMITGGYYVLYLSDDTPTFLFPIVVTLTRPGIAGVSFVVVLYSIYRTAQKWKSKQL